MSSLKSKSSPGESRKQNGSRKRKRAGSQDFDINGSAKNKFVCVVRTETSYVIFCRLRFGILDAEEKQSFQRLCLLQVLRSAPFPSEDFLSAQVFVHVSFIS